MKSKWSIFLLAVILLLAAVLFLLKYSDQLPEQNQTFDAHRAYQHVLTQVNFGPRTPGSEAQQELIEYVSNELNSFGWQVEIQNAEMMGHPIRNIIARRGTGPEWVILGAHYDSRFYADEDADPDDAAQPVAGANDGASGVAVLLELARVIPQDINKEIWLVFFDAEDQGRLADWDWILGSRAFVQSLEGKPDAVVVIDMIGDADLNIYREMASDQELTDEIWNTASELGFSDAFIDENKYSILDDHLPFIEIGIPAIDIIDIEYQFWHTSEDTADKVSPRSLEIVGTTLLTWLVK